MLDNTAVCIRLGHKVLQPKDHARLFFQISRCVYSNSIHCVARLARGANENEIFKETSALAGHTFYVQR